jgi:hypothetical protein
MPLVVVSGAIANKAGQGGEAWVRLSWLRGFAQLGCQVYLLEQIAESASVDRQGQPAQFSDSAPAEYFRHVTADLGLADKSALVLDDGREALGASVTELEQLTGDADLLVNISGHLRLDRLLGRFRRKAYIDIDPGFTQYWHADPATAFYVGGHDNYYTIGENIGSPQCPIPTGGIPWRPIRQPVVLDDWPVAEAETSDCFTTIANWRGPFGPVQFQGRTYGLKVHEFRKFIELPQHAPYRFELALNIHPADDKDRRTLIDNGWQLADPQQKAGDPAAFRQYVQQSSAEFSVAQGIYVDTSSGWFSDRSVRYLASGRPVLVQDTGLAGHLPVGKGLHVFRTLDEAVNGARRIVENYAEESAMARRLAEQYFDSRAILSRLLDEVGVKL